MLAGCTAIESAAKAVGYAISVPFSPGRADATEHTTDVESFGYLESKADGFRNYLAPEVTRPAEELLIDRAHLLSLRARNVLIGRIHALGANHGGSNVGVRTERPGQLTNDFFINLLDMNFDWKQHLQCPHLYEARESGATDVKWHASRVDLVFGANSQLRASDDANEKFVDDFVSTWTMVMNLDRFDLA